MIRFILILTTLMLLPVAAASQAPAPRAEAQFDRITLKHDWVCFAPCPRYIITIYADGRFEYEGVKVVKTHGKRVGRLTRAVMDELQLVFRRADYFSLRDEYCGPHGDECPTISITDAAGVTTSVVSGQRSKTIEHGYCCPDPSATEADPNLAYPAALTLLERQIEKAVRIERLIGTESEVRKLIYQDGTPN